MSDFLQKFKSVFIVEDGNAVQSQNTQDSAAVSSENAATPSSSASAPSGSGSVSDKFVEVLASALEKNNQDGFDYFEFRQSLKNLAKMQMDEPTRFQSAFAMAQTMGVTPSKLVDSAKFYLGVLNTEQSKFNDAHDQQKAKLVGSREDQAKSLEAAMQQKADQIKQLTQEIELNRQQSEQIRAEIADSTLKIESTKDDFEATFASVVNQIQDDMSKMQQYLK